MIKNIIKRLETEINHKKQWLTKNREDKLPEREIGRKYGEIRGLEKSITIIKKLEE